VPVYDLKCERCNLIEERMIKLSDVDVSEICLKCKQPMKRMISSPAIHLDNSFPGKAIKNEK